MDLIKQNGLTVKKIKGDFVNELTKRGNSTAWAMYNGKGEVFCMDGRPYYPIGGKVAFVSLIQQGCLNLPGFCFKPAKAQ